MFLSYNLVYVSFTGGLNEVPNLRQNTRNEEI